jgi:hypothetical protein
MSCSPGRSISPQIVQRQLSSPILLFLTWILSPSWLATALLVCSFGLFINWICSQDWIADRQDLTCTMPEVAYLAFIGALPALLRCLTGSEGSFVVTGFAMVIHATASVLRWFGFSRSQVLHFTSRTTNSAFSSRGNRCQQA